MTLVLVHGNPETAAIWDDLREQLGRDDVIALSPPGFGAPVPDGERPKPREPEGLAQVTRVDGAPLVPLTGKREHRVGPT